MQTVGVAGCGAMGLPMARQLQRVGYTVWGYDIRPRAEFEEFAERMLDSAAELSGRCDVVISVVRDQQQTDQLLFAEQGLIHDESQMKALVLSSTLDPNYVRGLQAHLPRSVCLLDAPMSGAPIGAERGNLSFMLSGDNDTLDNLMPMFTAMGEHMHRLGDSVGAGHTAKVLNNFSAAMSVAVTRQLMEMGEALGLPQEQLFSVMNSSSGQNWFSAGFGDINWAKQGYSQDNTIGILEKDVGCFAQAVEGLASEQLMDLKRALLANLRELQSLESD